ncbi:MAG: hypothetical protein WCD37_03585 [Chloroflexia bacterium]
MRLYRRYWRVPSSTVKDLYWLVTVMPNGSTLCNCPMHEEGKGAYPCWHAMLVFGLQAESARKVAPDRVVALARRGDLGAQMRVLSGRVNKLSDEGNWESVVYVTRTMWRYMEALKKLGWPEVARRVTRDYSRKAKGGKFRDGR